MVTSNQSLKLVSTTVASTMFWISLSPRLDEMKNGGIDLLKDTIGQPMLNFISFPYIFSDLEFNDSCFIYTYSFLHLDIVYVTFFSLIVLHFLSVLTPHPSIL